MATMIVDRDFFEHLLNCLANQKFIHEINADALSPDTDYKQVQREGQEAIDKAYRDGHDLLSDATRENGNAKV